MNWNFLFQSSTQFPAKNTRATRTRDLSPASKWITSAQWVDTWAHNMVMWCWSVAIPFWQLSIDHIVNVQYKRCGFAKTRLRYPSLPFHSPPYPTRTICRRVRTYRRTLGQSRDNQTKRGWPYSMSMGLCPTRASRAWEPRYKHESNSSIGSTGKS